MRDTKRIKKLLNLIEAEWNEHPDYRFYQLLTNLGIYTKEYDLWRVEDEDIIKALEDNLK